MLEKFEPMEYVSSIFDIDYDALKRKGIKGLFFDVDNTLMPFDVDIVPSEVVSLFEILKKKGFQLYILSNGRESRVEDITHQLKIEGVFRGAKPLLFGFRSLQKKSHLRRREIALIGDQMFTDVLGANRAGSYSILVKPISLTHDEKPTMRRRPYENKLLAKMKLQPKSLAKGLKAKASFGVDGSSKLLCVFGNPVSHTLSPYIHQIFIQKTNDNLVYLPFQVKQEDLYQAVLGARSLGIQGINVTIPHKEAILPYLASLDESAALVGAVNTLKLTDKGYVGYNTDVYGFEKLCQLHKVPIKDHPVLILGSGGAARSALAVSMLHGASSVYIYNRTAEKAKRMAEDLSKTFQKRGKPLPKIQVIGHDELIQGTFPIVFNTTSLGMYPHVDSLPVEAPDDFWEKIEYGLDMVFNPGETLFVQKIKSQGKTAAGGLSMLFYQGLRSYEIWTDRMFTKEECDEMHDIFLLTAKRVLENE